MGDPRLYGTLEKCIRLPLHFSIGTAQSASNELLPSNGDAILKELEVVA